MKQWFILSLAIIFEVIGTSSLKFSEGFTRFWPSVIVVACYASAFYLLSLTLKTIPVGVSYAIWSGVGTTLIVLVGWIFIGQKLDAAAIIGISLIVAGVAVLNIFSKSIAR